MNDILPSFKSVTDSLWGWAIPIVVVFLVSRIKATRIEGVPKWIVRALITYFSVTILYLSYGYYQRHKSLEVVRNQIFSYQHVQLDGKSFVNCKFFYCRLVYSGHREFNLIGSTYDTHCFIHFNDEAIRMVDVIGAIRRQPWLGHNIDKMIDSITKQGRPSPETVLVDGSNPADTAHYENE